jgi:hypothetical protein
MRENLIIVCAGDQSLHARWVEGSRNYDVMVIYFGDDHSVADTYSTQSDYFFRAKGLKLELARKVLLHKLWFEEKFDFCRYGYIWFADDDLLFDDCRSPNDLFEAARALKADIFQPGIQNNNFNPGWAPTRMIEGALAHRTNIVECMMPGFSSEFFVKAFFPALHALDFSKAGWGLEVIVMRIAEALYNRSVRTFVIDSVPINHTRFRSQGGGQSDKRGEYESTYIPQIHTNRIRTLAVYHAINEANEGERFKIERDEQLIEDYHRAAFARR